MNDELVARHRAITLRLEGRSIQAVCAAVGRSDVWFHKWWRRYLQHGPEGLYDLTRANQPGQLVVMFGIEQSQVLSVLSGLALIAFATVMADAVRLWHENSEII